MFYQKRTTSMRLKRTYTNEPTTFGNLISQRRNSATNWYCFDALGSTWNLTNAGETITDSYIYDAWGNLLNSTGTTTNRFQYVGQFGYYWDEETNSNYIRARVYQPTIARWTSADPLGFVDGLNIYAYVGNRPWDESDPSGRELPPPKICLLCPECCSPKIFNKPIASSTLSCKIDKHPCECDNSDDKCSFFAFMSGKKWLNGDMQVFLSLQSHPGKEIIHKHKNLKRNDGNSRTIGLPPSFNKKRCFGDFGRTGGGSITVTHDTGKCVYKRDMFTDPYGQPIKEKLSEKCFEIISVTPLQTIQDLPGGHLDDFILQSNGVSFNFKRPIRSIKLNFSIETFCGCGGFDNLGRPVTRNTGTMKVVGKLP